MLCPEWKPGGNTAETTDLGGRATACYALSRERIVQFLLLGPLEVRQDGRTHRPTGKQAALLATLALDAGKAVPRARLVDELWPDDPPETASKALDVYVWRLRKALPGLPIEKTAAGYRLDAAPDDVDVHRFIQLVADGRTADTAGDHAAAAELLGEALSHWRGAALSGVESPVAARLDEQRVAAREEQLAAELEAGADAELVADLEALVADEPLRERPRALLMLALYRSGRQAAALAAYQDARRTFVDELGIEPSPALRRLEQATCARTRSLSGRSPSAPTRSRPSRGAPAHPTCRPRSRASSAEPTSSTSSPGS